MTLVQNRSHTLKAQATTSQSLSTKKSCLGRVVSWLRGSSDKKISVKRSFLTAFFSTALVFSVVGIPLLIAGRREWEKQGREKKIVLAQKLLKTAPSQEKLTPVSTLKRHNQLLSRHNCPPLLKKEPKHFNRPSNPPWKTMAGVSLIADYLCEKNKLESLFVCSTLKAFQEKLAKLKKQEGNFRVALIVPTYQSFVTCAKKHCDLKKHQKPDFHAQHKLAVLIEKKRDCFRIFVSDSSAISLNVSQSNLVENRSFDCNELIHAYLKEAQIDNVVCYYSKVKRHHSEKGACETFALRDAVYFLKDPEFFSKIEEIGLGEIPDGDGSLDNPYFCIHLPPGLMKTAQSIRQLDNYKKENPDFPKNGYDLKSTIGSSKGRTFFQSLDLHTKDVDGVKQNKLIDDRIQKYHRLILKSMQELSKDELSAKVNKRLLS